jgi:hypothetical protein
MLTLAVKCLTDRAWRGNLLSHKRDYWRQASRAARVASVLIRISSFQLSNCDPRKHTKRHEQKLICRFVSFRGSVAWQADLSYLVPCEERNNLTSLVSLRFRNLEAGHESFGVMCEADAVHAVS